VADLSESLELADRWILSRLSVAVGEVTRHLEAFRVHEAASAVYHFFWVELADWYIELVKPRFRSDAGETSRDAAAATLVEVLDGVFRLLHPFMPFLTETLWQRLPVPVGVERVDSLVVGRWPERRPEREDRGAEGEIAALRELIGVIRNLRSEYNVPAGQRVEVQLTGIPDALRRALDEEGRALRPLAGVETVTEGGVGANGEAGAHAVLRGGAELFLPLAGVIDLERERGRLRKELDRIEGQLRGVAGKLSSEQFLSRAPAEVVAREREKEETFRDQRDRLNKKLAALA
jgi:valyl-tRNA synthetase